MHKLAMGLLVLPYMSAMVESLFSSLKGFKTSFRNQLCVESLEASLMMDQNLTSKGSTIKDFIPTFPMKIKYKVMWKKTPLSQTSISNPSNTEIDKQNSAIAQRKDDICEDLINRIQQRQQEQQKQQTSQRFEESSGRKDKPLNLHVQLPSYVPKYATGNKRSAVEPLDDDFRKIGQ